MVRIEDARNNITTMGYNSWGLLALVTEPATTQHPNLVDRQWATTFDAGGLPTGGDPAWWCVCDPGV
jgi:hypothetical protein